MATPKQSSLSTVPEIIRQLTEYERLIPPLSAADNADPTITADITMELLDSGYKLSVTATKPAGYTEYYSGLYPERCFIYEVQSGESADTFIKVMQLGDMEVIPAVSNGEAGTRYRTDSYANVYDNIQELQVARDTVINNLYALYTNVSTINRATSAMANESMVIPTDINTDLDTLVVKLLDAKASYLQTQAMVLAYKAEVSALGKIRIRVKSAEDQLKLVNVALNEIGTPDQLAQAQAFYKTFGETLDRLDSAFVAGEEVTPAIEAAATEAADATSAAIATATQQKADLRIPGSDLANTAVTSGYAIAPDVRSYVDSVNAAFDAIIGSVTISNDELLVIKQIQIPLIHATVGSASASSMRSQYESDKDIAARGIIGVQTMLSQIVPMIKTLAGIVQTTSESSSRIQALIETAETRLLQLTDDAALYLEAITSYTTQIQQYAPNFNPEQPFYRWVVNIEVVSSQPTSGVTTR